MRSSLRISIYRICIYIYIYNLIFHLRLNFTLSDPISIACQIISAFTFAGPSFHLIAPSSSSQPHIVFISNFNFISFSPRPYCLTLQPSFRSFRFVAILQPTIFNGSCSYLAQLLASVEKRHRLGHAWLSMSIFWDPVAL